MLIEDQKNKPSFCIWLSASDSCHISLCPENIAIVVAAGHLMRHLKTNDDYKDVLKGDTDYIFSFLCIFVRK